MDCRSAVNGIEFNSIERRMGRMAFRAAVHDFADNVIDSTDRCTTTTCGTGLLDARMALRAAASVVLPNPGPTTPTTPVTDTGGGGQTGWVWGLGLWAWLAAFALRRGRPASRTQDDLQARW